MPTEHQSLVQVKRIFGMQHHSKPKRKKNKETRIYFEKSIDITNYVIDA